MQMNKALFLVQVRPCGQRRSCRRAANPNHSGRNRGEGRPAHAVQHLVQPPTQPLPRPDGTALEQDICGLDNVCQLGARSEAISNRLDRCSSQPHHLVYHLIPLPFLISALLDKTALLLDSQALRHVALRSVRLHIRIAPFRGSTSSFFAP